MYNMQKYITSTPELALRYELSKAIVSAKATADIPSLILYE